MLHRKKKLTKFLNKYSYIFDENFPLLTHSSGRRQFLIKCQAPETKPTQG